MASAEATLAIINRELRDGADRPQHAGVRRKRKWRSYTNPSRWPRAWRQAHGVSMTPLEAFTAMQQLNDEIQALDNNALLDKWNAFQGSRESQVPDLGINKSLVLEAALFSRFGIGYNEAAKARKAESSDAQET